MDSRKFKPRVIDHRIIGMSYSTANLSYATFHQRTMKSSRPPLHKNKSSSSLQNKSSSSIPKSNSSNVIAKKSESQKETKEEKIQKEKDKKERIAKAKKEYKAELSRAKRAKYSSSSLSVHQVLKDVKNSASRHISNVKSSLDNLLSQKLHLTSPKEGHSKSVYDSGVIYYNEFENEPRTPVKLYSPFGIDNPSPASGRFKAFRRQRMRVQPKVNSRHVLSSPTGRIREDIRSITNSMNELSVVSQEIQFRFSMKTSPSNFSIITQ